jgi:hypothetical protein
MASPADCQWIVIEFGTSSEAAHAVKRARVEKYEAFQRKMVQPDGEVLFCVFVSDGGDGYIPVMDRDWITNG